MEGFEVVKVERDPLKRITSDFSGSVLLRFDGGVGDVLMGIGGVVSGLTGDCTVSAGVNSWQIPLVSQIDGIDTVMTLAKSKELKVVHKFDAVLDLHLLTTKEVMQDLLPDRDYYDAISECSGVESSPAKFLFSHAPELRDGRQVVAIHPWASNPNRRWLDHKWESLVTQLVWRDFHVVWLGTCDEFGYNASHVTKLSDSSSDLLWQSWQLAQSHFFIGCDSGFAHIAGMLGVAGSVIFTATEAKNVISRYPSLIGVDVFDKLGVSPSRSLKAEDAPSDIIKESIQPDDVLKSLHLDKLACTGEDSNDRQEALRYRIRIIDESSGKHEIASELSRHFDVVDAEYDAKLIITDESVRSAKTQSREVVVKSSFPPDLIHRILRELINS
jgi:hypothetical protein